MSMQLTHENALKIPQVVLAEWNGSDRTVQTPSQAVFAHRAMQAKCSGLDVQRVRVISPYLGGGFGSKGGAGVPCLMLACLAARQRGRPVRLELLRAQMFILVGRRHLGGARLPALAPYRPPGPPPRRPAQPAQRHHRQAVQRPAA